MDDNVKLVINGTTTIVSKTVLQEYAQNPKFKLKESSEGEFILLEKMNG